jgi:AAA domain (dynein-related subfamily)
MIVMKTFQRTEVEHLADTDLYKILYECWNIKNERIEVWGQIRMRDEYGWLYKTKFINSNIECTYPLSVHYDISDGVYIHPSYAQKLLDGESDVWIKCELELASSFEREKHNNPFLIKVKDSSAEKLKRIPLIERSSIQDDEISSYIIDFLYKFHYQAAAKKFQEDKQELELETAKTQIRKKEASDELAKIINEKTELELNISVLSSRADKLQINLSDLELTRMSMERDMSNKIEKLKEFIIEKVEFLKMFEFIDDEDYRNIWPFAESRNNVGDRIDFHDDLNGDYREAVSYIQAHLYAQDTLYPRQVIESYLTLIRSNDLIILAGDSGSGKTNLIKKFASAVGGVSKIIPVKPNWTSSEDLLGYYNPLEKKFLATPFLDALLEASRNPDVPYFICLDEMNLARVEYYFADFLSKLETRELIPEIQLYSDDESAHILSELRAVIGIIKGAKEKYDKVGIVDFVKLMQDEEVNSEMKRAFGFSDKDSLIKYHGDIRRMLAGAMNMPASIKIPQNVRIIGSINIDETTHYLSPKILDRAHIMKFNSPLLADWNSISTEISKYRFENVSKPLNFKVGALGLRVDYPKFNLDDKFCQLFISLNREFFSKLGVEFGMRTIRQGLLYLNLFLEVNDDRDLAINSYILHKVLPKFTFDGSKKIQDQEKIDLIRVLLTRLKSEIPSYESIDSEFSCVVALESIIENASQNDNIVNYWA